MTRLHARVGRHLRDDRGITLVEVLVTMFIMGVVGALASGAVAIAAHTQVRNDDENRGQQDAKVILDRMGRDARQARGVVCDGGLADPTDSGSADPGCLAHLQLWIDFNSDYVEQPAEIVTWRLEHNADGVHFDVFRIIGSGSSAIRQRQASSLIVRTLFDYDTPAHPEQAQLVSMAMQYDAIVGAGVELRSASFSTRLRNKGTK